MRRAGAILALAVLALMPVGAGATGHASLAMLAFAALFLLGNAVLRPGAVRLDRGGDLALLAVTAMAFSALLVGLGQTLRALAGLSAEVDLFGWVFAGAWALLLARVALPQGAGDHATDAAERALRQLDAAGRARPGPGDGAGTATAPGGGREGPRRGDARSTPRRAPGPPRRVAAQPRAPRLDPDRAVPHRAPARSTGEPAGARRAAPGAPGAGTAIAERPAATAPRPKEPASAMTDAPSVPTAALPAAPPPEIAAELDALDRLPLAGVDPDILEAAIAAIAARPALRAAPDALLPALQHRARLHETERDRAALVLVATDAAAIASRLGARDPALAFETVVAAADAASLARFSTRARSLIADLPAAAADLPSVPRLIEIADQIESDHEVEAEGLVDLANALEDIVLAAADAADA